MQCCSVRGPSITLSSSITCTDQVGPSSAVGCCKIAGALPVLVSVLINEWIIIKSFLSFNFYELLAFILHSNFFARSKTCCALLIWCWNIYPLMSSSNNVPTQEFHFRQPLGFSVSFSFLISISSPFCAVLEWVHNSEGHCHSTSLDNFAVIWPKLDTGLLLKILAPNLTHSH